MTEHNNGSEDIKDIEIPVNEEIRPRWEALYEKYADSVKNPSNIYLNTTD